MDSTNFEFIHPQLYFKCLEVPLHPRLFLFLLFYELYLLKCFLLLTAIFFKFLQ